MINKFSTDCGQLVALPQNVLELGVRGGCVKAKSLYKQLKVDRFCGARARAFELQVSETRQSLKI